MGGIKTKLRPFYRAQYQPYWRQNRQFLNNAVVTNDSVSTLNPELQSELWIWRPIMAQLVTLESVKSGRVNIEDLLKLNALLDMRDAIKMETQMRDSK